MCYYGDTTAPNPTRIDRDTFSLYSLNFTVTMIYLCIGYFCFALFTSYPMEFYSKAPYYFASILAVYLFQNIMLCPTPGNEYASLPYVDIKTEATDIAYVNQIVCSVGLLFWSCPVIWLVNNLLGKRTGNFLSFLLRSVFFFVILWWTLTCLLAVRLMIVDQVVPLT